MRWHLLVAGLLLSTASAGGADSAVERLRQTARRYSGLKSYDLTALAFRSVGPNLAYVHRIRIGYASGEFVPKDIGKPFLSALILEPLGFRDLQGKEVRLRRHIVGPASRFLYLNTIADHLVSAESADTEPCMAGTTERTCDVISARYKLGEFDPGERVRFWIDRETPEVRRVEWTERDAMEPDHPPVLWNASVEFVENQPAAAWLVNIEVRHPAENTRTIVGRPMPVLPLAGKPGEELSAPGRVLVLGFWHRWCGALCGEALGVLQKVRAGVRDEDVVIAAVALDHPEPARRWLAERRLHLPTYFVTPETVYKGWNVTTIPSIVLIDRNRTVVRHWLMSADENELVREIEAALKIQ